MPEVSINAPYVLRAVVYAGYIPKEGEVMRYMGSKDGWLELERVYGPTETVFTAHELQSQLVSEPTSRTVKAESTASHVVSPSGTSPHDAIDVDRDDSVDGDSATCGGSADAGPKDESDDEEDIPLAQLMPKIETPRSNIGRGVPSSSSPSAHRQARQETRRLGRTGPSTKKERLKMAAHIYAKGPQIDMTKEESWAGFCDKKHCGGRSAEKWLKIYINAKNRREIDENVDDWRGQ
ncbi:hypothetical protein PENSPDRAFT_735704 [Peniophora sp. CONT]|nr:hypothetical protein PENSPDRAFT_735704 [Peniophora sp. CONT]